MSILFLLLIFTTSLFAQTKQPNVIVILADDMGWNDVGYHGSEVKTPTLDRLIREGVELNNYYVHPACSPTRSALMTGKSALRLGILNPISKNAEKGLPLSETIMPQYFKKNEYQTWLVGKWHLGRFKKENWPNNRGFDHFYGFLTGAIGYFDHVHGGGYDWQRNGENLREEGYTTHLMTKEAIKLIEERKKDKPFLLDLSYAAPHLPNEAPAITTAEYDHIADKKRSIHAAMITEMDKGIQQIYETLEKEGLLDNTIIWFSSDNGGLNAPPNVRKNHLVVKMAEMWGRPIPNKYHEFVRGNIEDGASDNNPLKGGKQTVYEGGVRVPAFIYAPKLLKQQKIESRITINDLLPTLASAVALDNFDFKEKDGRSQWDFLRGKTTQADIPDFVIQAKGNYAFYRDSWKIIVKVGKKPELYDLSKDPTEQNNIAQIHPQIVASLKKAMEDLPRGAPIDFLLEDLYVDSGFFGGEEDRAPWAGVEGRNLAKATVKTGNPAQNSTAEERYALPIIYWGPMLLLAGLIGWNLNQRQQKRKGV